MAGRILVLDDEENYAEMLQDLLREHNYQVDMATRPERAIDQLEEIPYDLVISDYKMPVMDGADFLRKARELYPNLPFILVSGLMNTPELVKVANMSVTLVMEKPLDTAAFLTHVARFAEVMTEEEKAAFEREAARGGADTSKDAHSYPEEPRFFSAGCAVSTRFMQDAWNVSLGGTHLFILEPVGGDGVLAVKDISIWRGNVDKPIQEVGFEDFTTGGAGKVKELLSNEEMSDVISVRLSSSDQIAEAQSHLAKVLKAVDSAKATLFVYLVEGAMPAAEFSQMTESAGCILPALCKRPADVAQYARRFARLFADRSAKPRVAEFTPEAAYAVLSFDWPGNYQQIQDVISAAVKQSENTPMTLEALDDVLGEVTLPAPEARLAAFVKNAQVNQLEDALLTSGESVAIFARRLELGSNLQTKDDLRKMPLINSKLATL
jgi:CheY-like chemotaxis protein